jgi:hypothetical protein
MHQLFFPPRLEVVVEQQQSDGLASNGSNELSLHGLLGDEADCPPRKPIRRIGAHHRNDLLRLSRVQGRFPTRTRKVHQRSWQTARIKPPTYIADRLRCDSHGPSDRWCRLTFVK